MASSLTSLIVIAGLVLLAIAIWLLRPRSSAPGSLRPEPENDRFKLADFDPGNITHKDLQGLPVFVGYGSLPNNLGQTLLITVTGSSDKSVIEYFNMAKFHFELREPLVDLDKDQEEQEKEPDLSIREILKDKEGSVRVYFDLSLDTLKKNSKGSVLVMVDPAVEKDKYNNYGWRNPDDNKATVWVTVSEGKVKGKLYRDCKRIQTKTIGPGPAKKLSGNGEGYFDLTVEGDTAGTNKYQLTGTWNYGSNTAVTSESREDVPCP